MQYLLQFSPQPMLCNPFSILSLFQIATGAVHVDMLAWPLETTPRRWKNKGGCTAAQLQTPKDESKKDQRSTRVATLRHSRIGRETWRRNSEYQKMETMKREQDTWKQEVRYQHLARVERRGCLMQDVAWCAYRGYHERTGTTVPAQGHVLLQLCSFLPSFFLSFFFFFCRLFFYFFMG
jgi:hypothetical protein